MALTPEAGILELQRRMAAMELVPLEVMDEIFHEMTPLTPEDTGTLKGSLDFDLVEGGAMVYNSEETLEASRAEHNPDDYDYAYKNMHAGQGPGGPYPMRIEVFGRPTDLTPTGMGMWRAMAEKSFVMFFGRAKKVSRGEIQ